MRKKQYLQRIVAIYLIVSLLTELVSPSLALALTGGPSQPEMQSFEPMGTSDLVDPFTGDFNYNIPLFTVPGPNGGYPINLAYHSGIGMEEEASWVGLGWNINAGVITRELRGLPDDFNGDKVKRTLSQRPNTTLSLGFSMPIKDQEIFGFNANQNNASYRLTWNNYQGIGLSAGISLNQNPNKSASKILGEGTKLTKGLDLNYNSLTGETSLTPKFTLTHTTAKKEEGFLQTSYEGAISLSNLQAIKQLNFETSFLSGGSKKINTFDPTTSRIAPTRARFQISAIPTGASFSSPAFTPRATMPQTGSMIGLMLKIGTSSGGLFKPIGAVSADFVQTKYANTSLDFKGYGYLHSEGRILNADSNRDDLCLMDINREKETTPSKDIPSMPVPIATYDIYRIMGQGIGGVFRPFRSELGVWHDPGIRGDVHGTTAGLEVGPGQPIHVGANIALSFSKSYSGPWKNLDTWSELAPFQYAGAEAKPSDPLYEPFYFMNSSELVANESEENDRVLKGDKLGMNLMLDFSAALANPTGLKGLNPMVDVRVQNDGVLNTQHRNYNQRRMRSQMMSYKTIAQVKAYSNNSYLKSWIANNTYPLNTSPRLGAPLEYSYPENIDHHLAEISVTNPDGNRYIYALPAYNHSSKEACFSMAKSSNPSNTAYNDKIINYDPNDASTNNRQQDDHFYSATEFYSYAHSYQLTAIVSPDYVDLTGDGPSEDDLGDYTKFNYTKTNSNYHWRMPYEGANYLRGHISQDSDDKAGYTYGAKEIWYLNSIETKTHIAEFKLSPRRDGFGAGSEHQNVGTATYRTSEQLYKLDAIELYSKLDENYRSGDLVPLKTVHLEYTYGLCPGVVNNSGQAFMLNGQNANQARGKLTLKKVWISHLDNQKGGLSPYVFDYHETNPLENPAYDILQCDRWGNYQVDRPSSGNDNTINPYTSQYKDVNQDGLVNAQDEAIRNAAASPWTLKRIVVPSGAEINVEYEQDDYAYIQDKPAMQMMKILGFAANGNANGVALSPFLEEENQYLFFDLEDESIQSDADVGKYVEGIEDLFFKVYLNLKKNGVSGVMQSDYVEGYAEVEPNVYGLSNVWYQGVQKKCGFLKLKRVKVRDKGGLTETHPFRKAGWQYLKLERPDLVFPAINNGNGTGVAAITQMANSLLGFFQSYSQLLTGFYNYANLKSWASGLAMDKPSFVRLNSPDKIKYGGNYRVKRIVQKDIWAESEAPYGKGAERVSEYGQQYTYRMPDGTSSGVASYEPLIGGEEIPHHRPIRYSSPYFLFKNQGLYLEEPLGESYFPAPVVGYRRVLVQNIDQRDKENRPVTKTRSGTTVYEFYTSKEFPVQVTTSDVQHKRFNPKFPIPFVGSLSFEDHGFSQRMKVVTNDMHGKLRSTTTYAANANLNDPSTAPLTKVEYRYNTTVPFNPESANTLNSRMKVLFGDAYVQERDMGISREFFMDLRESSTITMKQGIQMNADFFVGFPPCIVFTAMPMIDYAEDMYKSVMAMEVVNQTGIVMETLASDGANTVTTKNCLLDANTGKPLLTRVTNDFDRPFYQYTFAANWAYDGMGNAARNAGASFDFNINAQQNLILNNCDRRADEVFVPGDEILVYPKPGAGDMRPAGQSVVFWVKQILGTKEVALIDEAGNAPSSAYVGQAALLQASIVRSGRRNQQAIPKGQLTSLTDPTTQRRFPLFDNAWNPRIQAGKKDWMEMSFRFSDCNAVSWDGQLLPDIGVNDMLFRVKLANISLPEAALQDVVLKFPAYAKHGDYYLKKNRHQSPCHPSSHRSHHPRGALQ